MRTATSKVKDITETQRLQRNIAYFMQMREQENTHFPRFIEAIYTHHVLKSIRALENNTQSKNLADELKKNQYTPKEKADRWLDGMTKVVALLEPYKHSRQSLILKRGFMDRDIAERAINKVTVIKAWMSYILTTSRAHARMTLRRFFFIWANEIRVFNKEMFMTTLSSLAVIKEFTRWGATKVYAFIDAMITLEHGPRYHHLNRPRSYISSLSCKERLEKLARLRERIFRGHRIK